MPKLKTLDDKLQAPKSRIGDAAEATGYVFGLIDADQKRAQYRTHIRGQVDGNAPYSKVSRDRTNLNFRQSSAIMYQFKVPYYDLLTEVPLLFEVETAFGNSEERSDWSQIISEEFHRMITDSEDFDWDFVAQYHQWEMLLLGVGNMYWPDALDWRPEVASVGEVLVHDEAPSRISQLEVAVIRKAYMATELMRYIDNEAVAEKLGWNVDEVKLAVKQSLIGQPPDQSSAYEWYQQKRKNSDLYFGTYECERVWTGHVLVKEFDQKVSHHLVRTDQRNDKYLYSKLDRFDSMADVLCPFFYDIGDGTWHSITGIGWQIYPYCAVFNQLRCGEVDAAKIASSVLLQTKDGASAQKSQMITLDNLKILPAGLNFIEHAIGQNLSATIDVRRDMEQGLINNIGGLIKAPGTANPRKGQKQAIMEMQQQAQLGKGNINRYYTALDQLGRMMFKKATNPALKGTRPGAKSAMLFRARCLRRNVPPQALQEIDHVKAYRSIGAGSAANALMITEAIMEIAPSLPEQGKHEALRLYISRLAGTHTADLLIGELGETGRKGEQDWQAAIENDMLRQGADSSKWITDDQNHVIHATSHLKDAFEHLGQVEQSAGQQPLALDILMPLHVHLEDAGPHIHQHLEKLKGDKLRENDYKELNSQFIKLARMADQVKHNVEQMQEEQAKEQQSQQQQPGISHEDAVKLLGNKDLPESMKDQLSKMIGVPVAPGDSSVSNRNLTVKQEQLNLKKQKEQQQSVKTDVELSQGVEKHAQEMAGATA